MTDATKFGLIQGAMLGGIGLLAGVIAGWIGFLSADGAEPVAGVIANVFLVLVLLLPGVLAFWTWASLDDADRVHYRSQSQAVGFLVVGSLLGSVLATLFFTVLAINIATIFGGEDNVALRLALMAAIGWPRALLVVVATLASGLALAIWASGRVRSET